MRILTYKKVLPFVLWLLLAPITLADGLSDKLYSDGVADLNAGSYAEAISKLRELLRKNPGYYQARPVLVTAYEAYGHQLRDQPDRALDQFINAFFFGASAREVIPNANSAMKLLGKNPESANDWIAVCEHYMLQYKYDEAYAAYHIAAGVHKEKVESSFPSREPPGVTHVYTGPPDWPVSHYFVAGYDSGYRLRMCHRIQQHWQPPEGYDQARIGLSFMLHSDGSFSDLKFESYMNKGKQSSDLPKELAEAAVKAVKDSAPFDPPLLEGRGPIILGYIVGEKKPKYGVVRDCVFYPDPNKNHFSSIRNPLEPESTKLDSPDLTSFTADLRRRVRQHWTPERGTETRRPMISFKIYSDGTVSDLRVAQSSGLSSADQAALKAIESAAPFSKLQHGAPASIDYNFVFDYNFFRGNQR